MSSLLELRDLCIRSPTQVLVEDVNLDVEACKVTALVGPSGAGKSLTARACMCVLDVAPGLHKGSLRYPTLDASRNWFDGVAGQGPAAQRRLLRQSRDLRGAWFTYSPQSASSALNPSRTIGRQLELAIRRRPESPPDMGREISAILQDVGLPLDGQKFARRAVWRNVSTGRFGCRHRAHAQSGDCG